MAPQTLELPGATARAPHMIELPAATAWPIVLAFGVSLVFAGLVTSASVSVLGAIFAVAGCVGWFREVLPQEKRELVPIVEKEPIVATSRPQLTRVEWMTEGMHRARLPVEIYPVSAGIKGGLAGSVAMAVLAILYGIISGHGIWYPINLLSAGFFPARATTAQIAAFHWDAFLIATLVHLVCSLLVVSPPPDSAGGSDRSDSVVQSSPQRSRSAGSRAQSADRLALVCHVSDRIRHRCRHRSFPPRENTYLAIPSLRCSRWY
jgi:hypothetical protein